MCDIGRVEKVVHIEPVQDPFTEPDRERAPVGDLTGMSPGEQERALAWQRGDWPERQPVR